ncbi:MAG: hypothetical protein AAGI45_18455, partial [Cyanobacteria bacterium P01_H01_bin.26]
TVNLMVVLVSVWDGASRGDVLMSFDEDSVHTWVSAIQLLATAVVSAKLYQLRWESPWSWRSPALLWLLIAFGFAFLAVDELKEIHESMDVWLHTLLDLQENAITDRIDDVIVGLYGATAVGLVYRYRQEIKRYKNVLPLIFTGFIVLFVMVFLDLLTNRPDVLSMLLGDRTGLVARNIFAILEEFCKLTAGSLFLGSIYRASRIERRMHHGAS